MNRALLTGWSKLASGNLASGLLQLAGFAIAAQALGAEALGVIVLIEAYSRFVDGMFNFQSVHVLTRFLAEADHRSDQTRFRGLVKAGLLIDVGTALIACALAIAALPLIGGLVGIPEQWITLAMIYALVIATRILGVTEAVLRCFDRFWAIGFRGAFQGALMVGGSAVAFWYDAEAQTFLAIWMISEIAANAAFLGWTLIVLRKKGVLGLWRAQSREAIRTSPGFWPILWQTNLTFGIRLLSQEADVLIAGALLGPAAAGLLRAAKNIAGFVSQFGRPLQQVASAPIARMWSEESYHAILAYAGRIAGFAAAAGVVVTAAFVVIGEPLLSIAFGAEFVSAAGVLVVLMLSRSAYLSGVTLLPTMLTLGLSHQFLLAVIISTAVFFVAIGVLVVPFGLMGIAWAHVAFDTVWPAIGWRLVRLRISDLRRPQSVAP